MRNIPTLVVGIALVVAIAGCTQQPTGVAAAAEAMGTANLNTIEYSGSGSHFAYGQAATPGERWPRFDAKTYAVAVDYQAPAMRLEMLRAQGEHPPHGGGAQPFASDQRTVQLVSGKQAWSEVGGKPEGDLRLDARGDQLVQAQNAAVGDQHRFDRDHQARPQPHALAGLAFVGHVRILMHGAADAMAAVVGQ